MFNGSLRKSPQKACVRKRKKKKTSMVTDKPFIGIKEDPIANEPGSSWHKFTFGCKKGTLDALHGEPH